MVGDIRTIRISRDELMSSVVFHIDFNFDTAKSLAKELTGRGLGPATAELHRALSEYLRGVEDAVGDGVTARVRFAVPEGS